MNGESRGDGFSDYEYIPLDTITAALTGDKKAIGAVTDRYTNYMWVVLRSLSRKRSLKWNLLPLEDLRQSVLLDFIADIKKFHFLKNEESEIVTMFDAYCKKVLYHDARDALNRCMKSMSEYLTLSADTLDGLIRQNEKKHFEKILVKIGDTEVYLENEKLADAIKTLRPKFEKIIELSFFRDWSDSDIAEYLKIEKKSVYQYRYEALIFLKNAMQDKR